MTRSLACSKVQRPQALPAERRDEHGRRVENVIRKTTSRRSKPRTPTAPTRGDPRREVCEAVDLLKPVERTGARRDRADVPRRPRRRPRQGRPANLRYGQIETIATIRTDVGGRQPEVRKRLDLEAPTDGPLDIGA